MLGDLGGNINIKSAFLMLRFYTQCTSNVYLIQARVLPYQIVEKYARGKVWQIDSFQVLGERMFGELIDQPIVY